MAAQEPDFFSPENLELFPFPSLFDSKEETLYLDATTKEEKKRKIRLQFLNRHIARHLNNFTRTDSTFFTDIDLSDHTSLGIWKITERMIIKIHPRISTSGTSGVFQMMKEFYPFIIDLGPLLSFPKLLLSTKDRLVILDEFLYLTSKFYRLFESLQGPKEEKIFPALEYASKRIKMAEERKTKI